MTQTKPQPRVVPEFTRGAAVIKVYIERCEVFRNILPKLQENAFKKIFGKSADIICYKYQNNEFGHWYLNIGYNNQIEFLKYIIGIQLPMPYLYGWEEVGKKRYPKKENVTMEDVRRLGSTFGDYSIWDLYPQDLIWFHKFHLYAYNNSIEDENYSGEKFGNYTNWAPYYLLLQVDQRMEFAKKLIEYN